MNRTAPPTGTTAPPGDKVTLIKSMGSWDMFALAFGAMIGFGWIVLSGHWLENAGTLGTVAAFVVGGTVMALVGLTYSELVAAMPKAGGEHNYAMRGLGPRWAFVCSWGVIGGYVTIVAFEAVALPRVVTYLLPDLNQIKLWTVAGSDVYLTWALLGVAGAVALTVINIVGIKTANTVQTFIMIFFLSVGGLLVAGAFVGGEREHLAPMLTNGWSGFFVVLVAVPFLFVGFDVIPQSAEEGKIDPRRIGKLIVVSVLMATTFYIVVVTAISSSMGRDALGAANLAAADGMAALWGTDFMAKVLVAGGIAAILTSWNAFMIGASRLMYAMSLSGMLPKTFGTLHPKTRTPVNALLFIGGISVVAPFFGQAMLGWLVESGAPSIIIGYLIAALSFLMLRRREPNMPRPLRVGGKGKGGLVIGVLAVTTTLAMLSLHLPGMPAVLSPQAAIMVAGWWLVGLVFFLRIPAGITPGEDAEERLLAQLAARS